MRDIGQTAGVLRGRTVRQGEIGREQGLPVVVAESGVAKDVGLHDAELDARHGPDVTRFEPQGAEARERQKRRAGEDRRGERATAVGPVSQCRGRRENQCGQRRQPMKPDDARDLGEHEIRAERHPEVVPGEAREQHAAQPLAPEQGQGEDHDPARTRHPESPGDRKGEARIDPEHGRQADDTERQCPGVFGGCDQEGRAEPVEPRR